jgi:hypothetical protein
MKMKGDVFKNHFMINATWQEMGANLGYAGMRTWSSLNQVSLPKLSF